MEDLLEAIQLEDLGPTDHVKVYTLLHKVLGNIAKNPTEPKFRTLKKDNKLVADTLSRSPNAISVLLALGFDDTGAAYHCPEDADLVQLQDTVEVLDVLVASCSEQEPVAAVAVAAPAQVAAPAPAPVSAPTQALAGPATRDRRSEEERKRDEQRDELAAARQAQQAKHEHHVLNPPPAPVAKVEVAKPASQGYPQEAPKKPKSAFEFENRAAKEQKEQAEKGSLNDLRAAQREKYKEFQADPNARQQEAYKAPASIADGGQVASSEKSWGDWVGGMFGGGGSSSSSGGRGGGGSRRDEPRKPQMKTINDLPKPVQRG